MACRGRGSGVARLYRSRRLTGGRHPERQGSDGALDRYAIEFGDPVPEPKGERLMLA